MFFLMPLNVVGEVAKVISISFRLFGNTLGGGIIIIVVSHLIWGLVLPPFLYGFFNFFVGTVQAFVFTMLTLVYISVQIR
jgi:F-type H+-transporting ATPase subunit a